MNEQLQDILSRAKRDIAAASSAAEVEQVEIKYLGRKGELTAVLRGVKDLAPDERAAVGAAANQARQELLVAFREAHDAAAGTGLPTFDVTLPGIVPEHGHLHLVTQAIRDITEIFQRIGFTPVRHPDVESDWYAFEGLNMPPDHPARDEWETFFMDHPPVGRDRFILTPHATSGTARMLAKEKPPIRVINIQKTYRRQSDATHVSMFHQFDGVYVDSNVTFRHLRGVLEYFIKSYFGAERVVRLRPFHFRFTEPSFEVDVSCGVCGGKGCKLCKQGWVELGGAGMLHPNVLRAAKLDPKKVSGLAFGFGVERVLLMRSGIAIPDIRILYENDLRFLEQF